MQYRNLNEKYYDFVAKTMTDKPESDEAYISWATDELSAEVGELKGVLAKAVRKHGTLQTLDYDKLTDELGDVLWSFHACLQTIRPDISLEDLMEINMEKLQARIDRGITYTGNHGTT